MNLCVILQMYFSMMQAHLGTPAQHMQLAQGGKYLETECNKLKESDLESEYKKLQKAKKEKEPKAPETKKEEPLRGPDLKMESGEKATTDQTKVE